VKLTYTARIENGLMSIKGRKRFDKEIDVFNGKDVIVTIEKSKRKRSNPQNAYYWGVVVNIVYKGLIDAGYEREKLSSDVVHDFLKSKFLKKDVVNNNGEYIEVVRSSTDLTRSEFMDFLSDVQRWSSEFLHVTIPNPNEQTELFNN
jgi:hypothetical protein